MIHVPIPLDLDSYEYLSDDVQGTFVVSLDCSINPRASIVPRIREDSRLPPALGDPYFRTVHDLIQPRDTQRLPAQNIRRRREPGTGSAALRPLPPSRPLVCRAADDSALRAPRGAPLTPTPHANTGQLKPGTSCRSGAHTGICPAGGAEESAIADASRRGTGQSYVEAPRCARAVER